ncbi:hypothetical protein RchiOBHm_Chr3g0476081 [Rosa chinensis]|uniref:Uncharacterized protein n=1 Tax=Rosa chinensis TaxID=74649 RepID=A0A2P6RCJ8_ROSCH|nr:hypothetical protein RchiOBHm_Chr3g0476081 [Rosa chinensis]
MMKENIACYIAGYSMLDLPMTLYATVHHIVPDTIYKCNENKRDYALLHNKLYSNVHSCIAHLKEDIYTQSFVLLVVDTSTSKASLLPHQA